MCEAPATLSPEQAAARRKGVRRTVLLFAAVAVLIYVGFLLMGMLR